MNKGSQGRRALLLAFLFACLAIGGVRAQTPRSRRGNDPVRVETVALTPSRTLKGTIRGRGSARYEIVAKKGQRLALTLQSRSRFLYANVVNSRTGVALKSKTPPREVRSWSGILPAAGAYAVDVYLVRAEARRGGRADYRLTLKLTGP